MFDAKRFDSNNYQKAYIIVIIIVGPSFCAVLTQVVEFKMDIVTHVKDAFIVKKKRFSLPPFLEVCVCVCV